MGGFDDESWVRIVTWVPSLPHCLIHGRSRYRWQDSETAGRSLLAETAIAAHARGVASLVVCADREADLLFWTHGSGRYEREFSKGLGSQVSLPRPKFVRCSDPSQWERVLLDALEDGDGGPAASASRKVSLVVHLTHAPAWAIVALGRLAGQAWSHPPREVVACLADFRSWDAGVVELRTIWPWGTGDVATSAPKPGQSSEHPNGVFGELLPVFVNCSNHPSHVWPEPQRQAALQLVASHGDVDQARIVDVPFPAVDAEASAEDVASLAERTVQEIVQKRPRAVFVAGDFSLTHRIVALCHLSGLRVVASASERRTVEELQPDGSVVKRTLFRFVQWRDYSETWS